MRILVTGGHGMLGHATQKVFSNHELILPEKKDLDVTNKKQIKNFENIKIDAIFHFAANTDLQKAEKDLKENYNINVFGTKNVLSLAKIKKIPFVFISSAMVFNGKKKSYKEHDAPQPINNYGKSKLKAEELVRKYKKHYILRNGWGFGGGPAVDKKFINKIYQQIASGNKKLFGITDIKGNATYTMDFAETLKRIIENQADYGTYHIAGKGTASRFDILRAFLEDLGVAKKIETIPVTLKEFQKIFPSPFPFIKNEVLNIDKIEKAGLSAMRDWSEALKEYSKEFKK